MVKQDTQDRGRRTQRARVGGAQLTPEDRLASRAVIAAVPPIAIFELLVRVYEDAEHGLSSGYVTLAALIATFVYLVGLVLLYLAWGWRHRLVLRGNRVLQSAARAGVAIAVLWVPVGVWVTKGWGASAEGAAIGTVAGAVGVLSVVLLRRRGTAQGQR